MCKWRPAVNLQCVPQKLASKSLTWARASLIK